MTTLIDMPADEYHALTDSVSRSMAAVAWSDGVAEYNAQFVAHTKPPKKGTKVMDGGSITHDCVLSDFRFKDIVGVYPGSCLKSNGHINPTPARAWEDEQRAVGLKYFLKHDDAERVKDIIDAVFHSEPGAWLCNEDKQCEKTIKWTDAETGLDLRCRPDFLIPVSEHATVYAFDFKVTDFVSPWRFRKRVRDGLLWFQHAFYVAGISAAFPGWAVEFRFIAVNPSPPHQVAIYELEYDYQDYAEKEVRSTLRTLAAAYESGKWEDDWQRQVNKVALGR